jgi:LysM repeat protein
MKQTSRILFFLLLNVMVSACTTLGVLYLWDRTRAPLPGGLIAPIVLNRSSAAEATPPADEQPVPTPQPSPTPVLIIHTVAAGDTFDSIAQAYEVSVDELVAANGYSQAQILSPGELLRVPIHPAVIESVVGAGDLASEHVVLVNKLDGELSLAGWQIDDGVGAYYTFPQVTLFGAGRTISLFTRGGSDSTNELFWDLASPIWQSGKVVTLRDPQGNVQSTYTVP